LVHDVRWSAEDGLDEAQTDLHDVNKTFSRLDCVPISMCPLQELAKKDLINTHEL
jgi:hypothetical protein